MRPSRVSSAFQTSPLVHWPGFGAAGCGQFRHRKTGRSLRNGNFRPQAERCSRAAPVRNADAARIKNAQRDLKAFAFVAQHRIGRGTVVLVRHLARGGCADAELGLDLASQQPGLARVDNETGCALGAFGAVGRAE